MQTLTGDIVEARISTLRIFLDMVSSQEEEL